MSGNADLLYAERQDPDRRRGDESKAWGRKILVHEDQIRQITAAGLTPALLASPWAALEITGRAGCYQEDTKGGSYSRRSSKPCLPKSPTEF